MNWRPTWAICDFALKKKKDAFWFLLHDHFAYLALVLVLVLVLTLNPSTAGPVSISPRGGIAIEPAILCSSARSSRVNVWWRTRVHLSAFSLGPQSSWLASEALASENLSLDSSENRAAQIALLLLEGCWRTLKEPGPRMLEGTSFVAPVKTTAVCKWPGQRYPLLSLAV